MPLPDALQRFADDLDDAERRPDHRRADPQLPAARPRPARRAQRAGRVRARGARHAPRVDAGRAQHPAQRADRRRRHGGLRRSAWRSSTAATSSPTAPSSGRSCWPWSSACSPPGSSGCAGCRRFETPERVPALSAGPSTEVRRMNTALLMVMLVGALVGLGVFLLVLPFAPARRQTGAAGSPDSTPSARRGRRHGRPHRGPPAPGRVGADAPGSAPSCGARWSSRGVGRPVVGDRQPRHRRPVGGDASWRGRCCARSLGVFLPVRLTFAPALAAVGVFSADHPARG